MGGTEKQKRRLEELKKLGWNPRSIEEDRVGGDTNIGEVENDSKPPRPSLAVDELMSSAVRTMRRAIKRHGVRARIAYNLGVAGKPESSGNEQERIKLLTTALEGWYELAFSPDWGNDDWQDDWARQLWNEKFEKQLPLEASLVKGAIAAGKNNKNDLREKLAELAKALGKSEMLRTELHEKWVNRWYEDDAEIKEWLKCLRKWLLPRRQDNKKGKYLHSQGWRAFCQPDCDAQKLSGGSGGLLLPPLSGWFTG